MWGCAKERSVEPTLLEVLGSLPDQRSAHGRRHPLGAIPGLAVCAMLVGLGVCTPSVSGGETKDRRCLKLWGSAGSEPPASPPCIRCSAFWTGKPSSPHWGNGWQSRGLEESEALAIDGKRLRGIHGEQLPWGPSGGSLCPSIGHCGGTAGGAGQEERVGRRAPAAGPTGPEGPGGHRRRPVHPAEGMSEIGAKGGTTLSL